MVLLLPVGEIAFESAVVETGADLTVIAAFAVGAGVSGETGIEQLKIGIEK
jgi:hypothetical protein